MDKKNLLVIVGPTAVGKTAISVEVANRNHGEIISADSSQVYRFMDIGNAKVRQNEMGKISHHLLDIVDPDHPFSVQEFQRRAQEAITEVHERGHLPILTGGTGLYIESVTHGYTMPRVETNLALRRKLYQLAETEGNDALHNKLAEVDPVAASKLYSNDRNRIVRALEVYEELGKPISSVSGKKEPRYNLLWIGLTMPREVLYERINQRVDQMMEQGLIQEVISLKEKGYHKDLTSMQAIGYKEIIRYLDGEISFDETVALVKRGTRRYAKRQLTWFRRIPEIIWFDGLKDGIINEIQQQVEGKFFLQGE